MESIPMAPDALVMDGLDMATAAAPPAGTDPADRAVAQVRAGDTEAFGLLVDLTQTRVLGLAWRLLGDRDQARDAAQEVYLRAFRSLGTFRLGESFPAWVHRITVNVCMDQVRKRGPATAVVDLADAPANAGNGLEPAEEAVLRAERRALVLRALGGLTPGERAALVLRDLEAHSTEEAASILGVKAVTVRSQICSARAKVQAFCAEAVWMKKEGSR